MIRWFLGALCRGGLIAGPCFIVLAVVFGIRTQLFIAKSLKATGTVDAVVRVYNQDRESSGYAPVFHFETIDRQSYTVTGAATSNSADFAVGQVVEVLYAQNDPVSARLATFWQTWNTVLNFGIGGVFGCLVAYLLMKYERKRSPPGWSFWLGPP